LFYHIQIFKGVNVIIVLETRLTVYIGPGKGHLTGQDIPPEKSEALTHPLCWNMQRSFDWSGHPSWEIRGTGLTFYVGTCKGHLTDQDILLRNQSTGLTSYVGTCKGHLTDQDIPPEKSEALDSPAMLKHAKAIWLIRTSLFRNQRHWTHWLCWTCKDHLTDQNIPAEK